MPKSKPSQAKKKTSVKPLSLYGVPEAEVLKDLLSYHPTPKPKSKGKGKK